MSNTNVKAIYLLEDSIDKLMCKNTNSDDNEVYMLIDTIKSIIETLSTTANSNGNTNRVNKLIDEGKQLIASIERIEK